MSAARGIVVLRVWLLIVVCGCSGTREGFQLEVVLLWPPETDCGKNCVKSCVFIVVLLNFIKFKLVFKFCFWASIIKWSIYHSPSITSGFMWTLNPPIFQELCSKRKKCLSTCTNFVLSPNRRLRLRQTPEWTFGGFTSHKASFGGKRISHGDSCLDRNIHEPLIHRNIFQSLLLARASEASSHASRHVKYFIRLEWDPNSQWAYSV